MNPLKVVLIDVIPPHRHVDRATKDLDELRLLVRTFGGIDVVKIIQHRTAPHKATFIGSGKVTELKSIIRNFKVTHLILNSIVASSQLYNLMRELWTVNPHIQVWDRIDLILNIFEKHARSAEAKLQIEIARMSHMKFRIYGLGGSELSRQAGGIGTRGIGETNIERMRRHFKKQIKRKKEELEKVFRQRQTQIDRRREIGIKTVSIVGYTNAGKTSLFNLLTGKSNQVKDALFVTLDSSTGKLHLTGAKDRPDVLISDTIGFIHNLPPSLIDSFKSTLMQSIYADLIVHVVDLSDGKFAEKIKIVEEIIAELGISDKKQVILFNKVDKLDGNFYRIKTSLKEQYKYYNPLFVSVKTNTGMSELKNQIFKML